MASYSRPGRLFEVIGRIRRVTRVTPCSVRSFSPHIIQAPPVDRIVVVQPNPQRILDIAIIESTSGCEEHSTEFSEQVGTLLLGCRRLLTGRPGAGRSFNRRRFFARAMVCISFLSLYCIPSFPCSAGFARDLRGKTRRF